MIIGYLDPWVKGGCQAGSIFRSAPIWHSLSVAAEGLGSGLRAP